MLENEKVHSLPRQPRSNNKGSYPGQLVRTTKAKSIAELDNELVSWFPWILSGIASTVTD